MRGVLVPAAVVLVALPSPAAELVVQERGFAITFPKPAQLKALPAGNGTTGGQQWIYEVPGEAYALTCFQSADMSGDEDPRLDAMRDALAGQFGARPADEQSLGVGGRAGRAFNLKAAVGTVRARLFVDKPGRQACSLMAIAGPKTAAQATAFLQSFRFLAVPQSETLSPAGAGFEVTFPAPTREDTLQQPEGSTRRFSADFEGVGYSLGLFSPKAKLDADPEKLLDGARDGILARVKEAKLAGETRLTVAGRPARDIELSAAGGLHMRARLLLDAGRSRMLHLMLVGRAARLTPERAAFFDSFRFVDAPAPAR